jgi:hypothetical protein
MFQSIWTIFRELTLVLAKVTLFEILPLKCSVKRFSMSWFRLCVYPVLCGVCLRLTPHSTGYFSKDQRELPEDGPYGLKHVGASIQIF